MFDSISIRLSFSFVLAAIACNQLDADDSWPQFRGPFGDGHARSSKAPVQFDLDSVIWKTDIPGKGWSSPVVSDGVIWMTTAVEQQPTDKERAAMLESRIGNPNHRRSRIVAKSILLQLIGIDLESGSIAKTIGLDTVADPDAIHTLNSYASPTPMIDGDRIIAHFGTYGTFCVDLASGQTLWHRRFPLVHSVGPGSSPLVCGDVVVLIQDGVERQYVIALNKDTG